MTTAAPPTAVPVPLLDLKAQYATIKDEIDSAIREVVESQTFILGPAVERLEKSIGELSQTRYAIACASGTDALLLALKALDVGPGDEVITTPFTFFATAGTIHNVGATPVFVDIDPRTYNVVPDAMAAAVTPRTKACIPVDLFGQMAAIEDIARLMPNVPVIEDAAQTIGASRRIDGEKRMAGEVATIGTFSFYPSKNLGAYGDGGMLVTQNERLASILRKLRTHGGLRTYYHDMVGFNSRLDAIQAAVLQAKLPHLERWSAKRAENAAYYTAALGEIAEIGTPYIEPANNCIFNQYTIRVERRDELQAYLKERGIGTAIYYPLPLHLQTCFGYLGYKEGSLPESERAAKQVLSLPIFPELTQQQLDRVIGAIRAFYGRQSS
ncbi:MAG TPA: DegT/DnrJ/EryC1/StrS family aminotransferase [Gemmatimonadaceae bacterium]|nr:DegT/DnrJ/EryC1/StrS family aminotransferase [Gemmatimonadaceae bacterium]